MEELDKSLKANFIETLTEKGFLINKNTKNYLYFTKQTEDLIYMVEIRRHNDSLLKTMGLRFTLFNYDNTYDFTLHLRDLQEKGILDNQLNINRARVEDSIFFYNVVIKAIDVLMQDFKNINTIVKIYESSKYPMYMWGHDLGFLEMGIIYLYYNNDVLKGVEQLNKFIESYKSFALNRSSKIRIKYAEMIIEQAKIDNNKELILQLIDQMQKEINRDL